MLFRNRYFEFEIEQILLIHRNCTCYDIVHALVELCQVDRIPQFAYYVSCSIDVVREKIIHIYIYTHTYTHTPYHKIPVYTKLLIIQSLLVTPSMVIIILIINNTDNNNNKTIITTAI